MPHIQFFLWKILFHFFFFSSLSLHIFVNNFFWWLHSAKSWSRFRRTIFDVLLGFSSGFRLNSIASLNGRLIEFFFPPAQSKYLNNPFSCRPLIYHNQGWEAGSLKEIFHSSLIHSVSQTHARTHCRPTAIHIEGDEELQSLWSNDPRVHVPLMVRGPLVPPVKRHCFQTQ